MAYVRYNLHLRERQLIKRDQCDPLSIRNIRLEDSLEEWITKVEDSILQGDEVHLS